MTLTREESSFLTKSIISVGLGVGVLGVGFLFLQKTHLVHILESDSGDSPVVLVGGSMTFKAGATRDPKALHPWKEITAGQEYSISATNQISKILLKNDVQPDDDNTSDDDANSNKDRQIVPAGKTWVINEFSVDGGADPVIQLSPSGNEIHLVLLDGKGKLCFVNGRNLRLRYLPNIQSCPPQPIVDSAPPVLSQISVKRDKETTPVTLSCIDSNGDPAGKCKLVFKEKYP